MKRSISLPTEQDNFLQQQVESGQYASVSEVVLDAVRLLQHQKELRNQKVESLRADIQKGFDSIERGEGQSIEQALADLDRAIAAAKK